MKFHDSMNNEFYLFICLFQPPTVPRGDDYDEETNSANKVGGESTYREVTDCSETTTVAGSSGGVTVKQEPSLESKNVMNVIITLNFHLFVLFLVYDYQTNDKELMPPPSAPSKSQIRYIFIWHIVILQYIFFIFFAVMNSQNPMETKTSLEIYRLTQALHQIPQALVQRRA